MVKPTNMERKAEEAERKRKVREEEEAVEAKKKRT
jgi:hypothetical protein